MEDPHRITMTIMIDLDAVPGTMHTRASAEENVQTVMLMHFGHYNPVVTS